IVRSDALPNVGKVILVTLNVSVPPVNKSRDNEGQQDPTRRPLNRPPRERSRVIRVTNLTRQRGSNSPLRSRPYFLRGIALLSNDLSIARCFAGRFLRLVALAVDNWNI